MNQSAQEITPVFIEQEMKQSYLSYSMSVIVGRALPDVRDGLKPVHRRVLYAMQQLTNDWNKPYKKSARIVGDVIGKYHPHGESAIYESIVRMAQDFSMRYVLIDGQGNFGSVDGDPAAAMRYTEVRMSKVAHALLVDLEKDTVDFTLNYDETEILPTVLPTRLPNLLVNGSSGIAVGMATNIPPHNLSEVINACLALLENPDISIEVLMLHLPGPDFPTAGIINGKSGILEAYHTGRGRLLLRAKVIFETNESNNKQSIIIHELPYQVNKAKLLEKISDLVKEKKLEGISTVRDESDRDGMRVVIEVRKGENIEVLLNHLYMNTQLQITFAINMVALDQGQPKTLNLRQLLDCFIQHRRETITRRTLYELRKAKERIHLLEGMAVALENIDHLVMLIKSATNVGEAKTELLAKLWMPGLVTELLHVDKDISRPAELSDKFGLLEGTYRLSSVQVQAILDLRLHRLTSLEKEKILNEYKDLITLIHHLSEVLKNPDRLQQLICDELKELQQQFSDPRRTQIIESEEDFTAEDLIPNDKVVVTLSHDGYAKTQLLSDYQAQRRGGKGKSATVMKVEDFVEQLRIVNKHATLLCFSNFGKVYWIKTYLLPQASRLSRGKPLVNLLPLQEGERINTLLSVENYFPDQYIVMATAKGIIKKVSLTDFSRPRNDGIIAILLDEGDQLVGVEITDGQREILLFSDEGKVVRFLETKLRVLGRKTRGVRGIRLKNEESVIALIVAQSNGMVLAATANGFGKRTSVEAYRLSGRGTQGVISIRVNKRNGKVVGALEVLPENDIMLISDQGRLVRTRVNEISVMGRSAQGVRLIRLEEGETLVSIQKVVETESENKPDILPN